MLTWLLFVVQLSLRAIHTRKGSGWGACAAFAFGLGSGSRHGIAGVCGVASTFEARAIASLRMSSVLLTSARRIRVARSVGLTATLSEA